MHTQFWRGNLLYNNHMGSCGYRGLFPPGVKRLGREADHSPPTSAEVKNTWMYTSTPPIRLHGVVLNYLSTGTTFGRVKNFIFSTSSRPVLETTQTPIQWVPGVKQPGREADHSPPQLMPRSRTRGSIHPLRIRLHGVVLN
jgi:hypothetical protein